MCAHHISSTRFGNKVKRNANIIARGSNKQQHECFRLSGLSFWYSIVNGRSTHAKPYRIAQWIIRAVRVSRKTVLTGKPLTEKRMSLTLPSDPKSNVYRVFHYCNQPRNEAECWQKELYQFLLDTPRMYDLSLGKIARASKDKRWQPAITLFGPDGTLHELEPALEGFNSYANDQKALEVFITHILEELDARRHFRLEAEKNLLSATDSDERKLLERDAMTHVGDEDTLFLEDWKAFFGAVKDFAHRHRIRQLEGKRSHPILNQKYLTSLRQRHRQRQREARLVLHRKAAPKWGYDPQVSQYLGTFL